MPVLKNKTQGNYVNVYKGIVLDHSLSLKDRGMLLTLLSLPDSWEFTIAGLGKILPDGKAAINSSLASLQRTGYLTKEQTRGKKGVFSENVIEVHETPIQPFSENRLPGNRPPDKRVTGKPPPDNPSAGNQPQLNTKKTNIHKLNHQGVNIHQSNPSIVQSGMEIYRKVIRDNISYDALVAEYPFDKQMIDEIVELAADIAAIPRKTVRIGREDYPYEAVKSRFLKLEREHIEYVVESLNHNTTKITNIRNYMLTALYYAPDTFHSYINAKVNYEQFGGGNLCQ